MLNILIVDDSRSVHKVLDNLFKETVHKLKHEFNGKDALNTIKSTDIEFNVVLLDWEMPIMSGPEFLKNIKLESFDMPVIMLTSKNRPDQIEKMLELGARDFIMKPFTQDIVFGKIENVLDLRIKVDEPQR